MPSVSDGEEKVAEKTFADKNELLPSFLRVPGIIPFGEISRRSVDKLYPEVYQMYPSVLSD
jgi:hypothetical protein